MHSICEAVNCKDATRDHPQWQQALRSGLLTCKMTLAQHREASEEEACCAETELPGTENLPSSRTVMKTICTAFVYLQYAGLLISSFKQLKCQFKG